MHNIVYLFLTKPLYEIKLAQTFCIVSRPKPIFNYLKQSYFIILNLQIWRARVYLVIGKLLVTNVDKVSQLCVFSQTYKTL